MEGIVSKVRSRLERPMPTEYMHMHYKPVWSSVRTLINEDLMGHKMKYNLN